MEAALPEGEEDARSRSDYDSYYSGLISFVFHFCLYLALSLLAGIVAIPDKLPPATDVVHVADTSSSGKDADEGMSAPEGLESVAQDPATAITQGDPLQEVADIKPTETPTINVPTKDLGKIAKEAKARGQSAADAARAKLTQGLGGGTGGNGSGQTGRAGRAARWVLRFNTASPRDHLAQLGGLQADVAFPDRGDDYRYFTNLGGTPISSVRALAQDGRIFWMDQDRSSFSALARELGVASAEYMIAFLPQPLEAKMLKLEMSYASEKGVTSEDGIAQTVFECVRRAGSYDVMVVDQTLQ